MANNTQFAYPPLPSDVDSLRILTVAAGDFYDALECTLTPMAFGAKPRYVALSYSWGDSYEDMSRLPVSSSSDTTTSSADTTTPVVLNGQPFYVRHNLHLALLHLRSPTHPISLWADAICINQADTAERNWQVSLMSFIYSRAVSVVAWIGTKRYPSTAGLFRVMWLEWKGGETQHLASSLAVDPQHNDLGGGTGKMRWSPKPNPGTVARIAESVYWTRLWIVQEVCIPRVLVLVYGSEAWLYDDFRQRGVQPVVDQGLPPPVVDVFGFMQRLLETRDQRHTDVMTLENLMERFASSSCGELRDRVYGLLGCANDIYASVQDDGEPLSAVGSGEDGSGKKWPGSSLERQRGVGSLRVDYSRSFYQIWVSVIEFIYFQAKNVEGRFNSSAVNGGYGHGQIQRDMPVTIEERRISIVRTAGIVQKALGQSIEQQEHRLPKHDTFPTVIRVAGYVAGEIVWFGANYKALVGSARAWQDWTSSWVKHTENPAELEVLRRIGDDYQARLLDLEEEDLRRIRSIDYSPYDVGRLVDQDGDNDDDGKPFLTHVKDGHAKEMPVGEKEPQICLGTGCVMGLVPPAAQTGDIVVRFWNCNAAVVMRPVTKACTTTTTTSTTASTTTEATEEGTMTTTATKPAASYFTLVGRADVAEVIDRGLTPGRDPHAEQCLSGSSTEVPGFRGNPRYTGPVYVDLDLRTLQAITACIRT